MMKQLIKSKLAVLLSVIMLSMLSMVSTEGWAGNAKKQRPPFDPKRFEAELEQYITTHAGLTPREAARFFPVYRQRMKKMRFHFDAMRRFHYVNPKDERACMEAIRRQDELDIEMKQLQQEYHSRFLYILPASKVLRILKAEEQFHRQAFKKANK